MESEEHRGSYEIDVFRPEDAQGVVDLFRSVYGEGYPVKLVYHPSDLITAFEKRENIPVVARTPSGRILGYEALYRSAPNPELYEAGQGLVAADCRGDGINLKINEYLLNVFLPTLDVEGIFGEAVCNHTFMQKIWSTFQPVETAIEVDLMPGEAYETEGSATGRVATILSFRISRARKQTVFLPARYSDQFQWIYSTMDGVHNYQEGDDKLPSSPCRIDVQVFDFARVARITAWEVGDDFEVVLSRQEEILKERGVAVVQVWLNLSWPSVNRSVELLRRRGFFFGGLLPRWFGTDGLLMQRVMQRPNWEGIHLYSDRSKGILKFVRQDWEENG